MNTMVKLQNDKQFMFKWGLMQDKENVVYNLGPMAREYKNRQCEDLSWVGFWGFIVLN